MRERVAWSVEESVPARDEALALQGIPAGVEPPRVAALLDEALRHFGETAQPRAIVADLSAEAFAEVYRGEGRNAAETPLARIFPRAVRLALFVATVGGGPGARLRQLFARNEPALAVMLDSVASAAADRLSERLAARLRDRLEGEGQGSARVLAYSPGYCGWHVSGQGRLFAALAPEEIGVTLNASFLMEPLKSVSGVLVAGPAEIHRFPPSYTFCAECRDRPCRTRLATLRAG